MDLATWRNTQPRGALTELSKATGVRWQTLYDIARGKHRPQVETAKAIATATNGVVTVHELLGIEEHPEPAYTSPVPEAGARIARVPGALGRTLADLADLKTRTGEG